MLEIYAQYNLVTYIFKNVLINITDNYVANYNGHNYKEWMRSKHEKPYERLEEWIGDSKGLCHYATMSSHKWGSQPLYKKMCVSWFCREQADLYDAFIDEVYGDINKIIDATKDSQMVCADFLNWFDNKRRSFMSNMDMQIAELSKGALKKGVKASAHGGVANLLKVLTKTMEKQGADISSIAKVQYAVCTQAGIYIPEEFVMDVAVGLDIAQ